MAKSGKHAQLRYSAVSNTDLLTLPIYNYSLDDSSNYLVHYWSIGDNTPIREEGVNSGNLSFVCQGNNPNILLLKPPNNYLLANLYYDITDVIDELAIMPASITFNWLYSKTNWTSQYWEANYFYCKELPVELDVDAERIADPQDCYESGCTLKLYIDDLETFNRVSATLRLIYNKFDAYWQYYGRHPDLGTQDFVLEVRVNGSFEFWKAQRHQNVIVKIYINDTEFWEFKWMKMMNITNVVVSPRTAEIREMTLVFGYNRKNGSELGYVKLPDGSTLA